LLFIDVMTTLLTRHPQRHHFVTGKEHVADVVQVTRWSFHYMVAGLMCRSS